MRIGQRHPPEARPDHFGDAVVRGQALVDERVVRREQIDHVAVLADDAVEEQLRLALHRLEQVVVGVGIEIDVRIDARRARAGGATARRSSSPAHSARGSASMRRTWRRSTCRIPQLRLRRQRQQLVVGDAAPEEERQPRRQVDVVQLKRRAGSDAGRRPLEAKHELGMDQDELQREPDAGVEAAARVAVLVGAPDFVERRLRDRPAECPARQRRQNRRGRRRGSSAGRAGRQTKIRAPARHVADAGDVVGAYDAELAQVRQARSAPASVRRSRRRARARAGAGSRRSDRRSC